jgi:hypothetical protein
LNADEDAHKELTPNRINRLRVENIFTAAMGYLPDKDSLGYDSDDMVF